MIDKEGFRQVIETIATITSDVVAILFEGVAIAGISYWIAETSGINNPNFVCLIGLVLGLTTGSIKAFNRAR